MDFFFKLSFQERELWKQFQVLGLIISHQLLCIIQKLFLAPYLQWAWSDRGKKGKFSTNHSVPISGTRWKLRGKATSRFLNRV